MILRYSRLKDNKDDWAPSLMLHPDLKFCNSKSDLIYSLQPKMEKLYAVSENKTGSGLCKLYLNKQQRQINVKILK